MKVKNEFVKVHNKKFIIVFDENGEPKHIRQRCQYKSGPQAGLFYDNTIWNAKHHGKAVRGHAFEALKALERKRANEQRRTTDDTNIDRS